MLPEEDIEYIKGSFYGWEYCVERDLAPTITVIELHALSDVFRELDELRIEVKKQTKRNNCLMCGDNATEFKRGGYYCEEC